MTGHASYAYNKRWRHERCQGLTRLVVAAPATARVKELLAAGWSVRSIAEAAGVSPSVVSLLGRGQRTTVKRDTARRLLKVQPEALGQRAKGRGFVPKVGAVRRIQALLAIGHRHQDITAAMLRAQPNCGTRSQIVLHQRGDWIARVTRDAVCAAYEELGMTPGCSGKTRRLAAKYGYPPPLAWDDDTIDEPTGQPAPIADPSTEMDEVAVHRLMAGTLLLPPNHGRGGTQLEMIEAIRRLATAGHTDREIGERIGRTVDAVLKLRARYDIPAATTAPAAQLGAAS